MDGDDMSEALDKIVAKKAEKIQAAKERKEDRQEQGIINKLVIEMNPTGLFFARYSLSGQVPEELRGMFTRKDRILAIAERRNIPVAENA
tara:strand:- start:237 stop:506 length:270 start_codon:yes stop_codon:yes gene_type:complete